MKIEDEVGRRWMVMGGDRAAKAVNGLRRVLPGLDFIVLPCYTLATGNVTEPDPLPDDVVRRVRLRDCLALLKEA